MVSMLLPDSQAGALVFLISCIELRCRCDVIGRLLLRSWQRWLVKLSFILVVAIDLIGRAEMSTYNIINEAGGQIYIYGGGYGQASDGVKYNIINQPGGQLFVSDGRQAALQQSSARNVSTLVPGQKRVEHKRVGVAATCTQSVVKINGATTKGTGSVWDREGHVVTNDHVADCNYLKVTLSDGTSCMADVVGRSKNQDLALLKLRGCYQSKLKPVVPSSQALKIGQSVFTIGYPLHCDKTVTNGFVSSFPMNPIGTGIRNAIQLDAMINPGNSGGPLYDSNGYFVGVIVSSYSSTGIAYAIPLNTVTQMVEEFKNMESKQQVGVTLQALNIKTSSSWSGYHNGTAPGRRGVTLSVANSSKVRLNGLPMQSWMSPASSKIKFVLR